jgi:hypothetical protein
MNRYGAKVNKTQFKQNERCLTDHQKGKLTPPTGFNDCVDSDPKGRMARVQARTAAWEARRCDPLAPPPYAYTSSLVVNAAADAGARTLVEQIFGGPPVLDADLATRANDTPMTKCQSEMLKWAGKLENTVIRELNREKKRALRDATVNTEAALEARLQTVFVDHKRLDNIAGLLKKKVNNKCSNLQTLPSTIFPGSCANPNLGVVEDCVIAAARCEACLSYNDFDALNLDCDLADDESVNASCP